MYTFKDLVEITAKLRAEDGCPWDREQDHKSIRSNFLEETHEALEAIEREWIKMTWKTFVKNWEMCSFR